MGAKIKNPDKEDVLNFIKEIRDSFNETRRAYLNGSCYKFYKILDCVYDGVEPYYIPVISHIVSKIGDDFFDIEGDMPKFVTDKYIPEPLSGTHVAESCKSWIYDDSNIDLDRPLSEKDRTIMLYHMFKYWIDTDGSIKDTDGNNVFPTTRPYENDMRTIRQILDYAEHEWKKRGVETVKKKVDKMLENLWSHI